MLLDLYGAANKLLKKLGTERIEPAYAGMALGLFSPETGKLGAYVDKNGVLRDGDGDVIGSGGGGSIDIGNSLFVDEIEGESGSGRGGFSTPFDTLVEAVNTASSGDCVFARPGTYNERGWARNGVAIKLDPNSIATYTGSARGALIDDSDESGTAGAIVARIEGDTFSNLSTHAGGTLEEIISVVTLTKSGSRISLRAVTLGSTSASTALNGSSIIDQRNGQIDIEADRIIGGDNCFPIYWWKAGGRSQYTRTSIEALGAAGEVAVTTAVDEASSGDLYIMGAPRIFSNSGTAIDHQDLHSSARCWFVGTGEIGGASCAINNGVTTGAVAKYYYLAIPKIYTTASGSNVIFLNAGQYWFESISKLLAPAGAVSGITLTGNTIIEVLEIASWEFPGSCTRILVLNGASVVVKNMSLGYCKGSATTGGILVIAGSLRLNDSEIDTSLNSGTSPLSGAASQTIYLRNVHLHAHGSANSITNVTGSGALTVICRGACSANRPVGANVTVIGNLNYDASL